MKQQIHEQFESVRRAPLMFLGEAIYAPVYLSGFMAGLQAAGVQFSHEHFVEANGRHAYCADPTWCISRADNVIFEEFQRRVLEAPNQHLKDEVVRELLDVMETACMLAVDGFKSTPWRF